MACSILHVIYMYLLLSYMVSPAELQKQAKENRDEKLHDKDVFNGLPATVLSPTAEKIANNNESDRFIKRNKSKVDGYASKDIQTSPKVISFINTFINIAQRGVNKDNNKDEFVTTVSENFYIKKDKLIPTTPFSKDASGDKNTLTQQDMTNNTNYDSIYNKPTKDNIYQRSIIYTEKPNFGKDKAVITDKGTKVQDSHVKTSIDKLSSLHLREQSPYNDLGQKDNVSLILGQADDPTTKTIDIEDSTEVFDPAIVKEDTLSLLSSPILDSKQNYSTESQKSIRHGNIDSGTLKGHTSSGNIPYTEKTDALSITWNYRENSNFSQTLFISGNTTTKRAGLVASRGLITAETQLFTDTSTQSHIENIDKIQIASQRSTVTSKASATESTTAVNELQPVLHPRTNIFNGVETEKEDRKVISSRNGGRVIGLDRRRVKMAEGDVPTIVAEQEIIDLVKSKVPQEGAINWTTVRHFSHAAWSFHCHVVGIGFIILAVYSIASIIRLYKRRRLLSRGYFMALNSTMVVIGVLRGIFFLVDPYNVNGIFPQPLAYFFLNIGFPCLTSAFSILFMALLQTTRVQLISPTIQKPKVLAGIIIFHFLLSFVSDLIVGLLPLSRPVQLVSQITFVVWTVILAAGYLFIFRKLYKAAQRRQKEMLKLLVRKINSQTGADSATIKVKRKLTLSVAVKVTLIVAILAIVACGVQIYGMAGPFNVFRTDQPNPWAIWTYITLVRFIELGMCFTMSYVATQPLRFERGGSGPCGRCFHAFCSPCRQIFDCRKRDYDLSSEGNVNWSDLQSITNASTSGSFRKISAKESAKSPSEQVGLTSVTNEPKYAKMDNKFGASTYSATPASYQYDSKQQRVKPLNSFELNSNNDSGVVSHSPSGDGNTLASQQSGKGSRPSSLLINDQGYIRARMDADTDGVPVLYSTDDELDGSTDVDTVFAKASLEKSTPTSPKSYDGLTSRGSSEFSFSPPSMNLRQSIEGALDHYNVRLQTPDILSERKYKDSDKYSVASRNVQSADELSRGVSPDFRDEREVRSADSLQNRDLQSWKHAKHKKSIENLPYQQIRNDNANNNNNCNSSESLSNSNASLFRHFTFPDGSPLSISLDDLDLPFCKDMYEAKNESDSSRYTFHNSVYNYNGDELAYV